MVNVIIIALSYTINAAESDLHKIKHERMSLNKEWKKVYYIICNL